MFHFFTQVNAVITAENTEISVDFMVWKSVERHSFARNYAFLKNLHNRKLCEITVFYAANSIPFLP